MRNTSVFRLVVGVARVITLLNKRQQAIANCCNNRHDSAVCINCTSAARRVDAGLQRVLFQLCSDPCWIPEYCVTFEVPSAVSWDVTPCNLINICQRSEVTCFIRQDGGRRLLRNAEKIRQTTRCRIPKDNGLPWLGHLMADLSPRTPSFSPRPVSAGVMVEKVALGWFFFFSLNLQAPRFLYIGQAFRYSPENAFYIFNQQIYFII